MRLIDVAALEIIADVIEMKHEGHIPWHVIDFNELHDYCDANVLGGDASEQYWNNEGTTVDTMIELQDIVDSALPGATIRHLAHKLGMVLADIGGGSDVHSMTIGGQTLVMTDSNGATDYDTGYVIVTLRPTGDWGTITAEFMLDRKEMRHIIRSHDIFIQNRIA